MPPDDKLSAVRSRLDPIAAAITIQNPRQDTLPAPADPDGDDLVFEDAVYRYAARWLASHANDAGTARPFAFVFSRSITQDEATLSDLGTCAFQRYDAFRHQQMNDVTGCIVLATMNLEKALVVTVEGAGDTQALLSAIDEHGHAERFVVAFEPAYANLILCVPGRPSRALNVKQPGQPAPWAIDQLEAKFVEFHKDFTRTPNAVLEPWFNAGKGLTSEKLEIRISKTLAYMLDRNFAPGSVLAEAATPSGRMDVFIVPHVLDSGAAVIEVKVLRSNRRSQKVSHEFNVWWASKGVIQADLYRNVMQATHAYLCCWDAREHDTACADVDAIATARNVRSLRYFMYRSTDNLHQAELAKAQAIASSASGAGGSQ